MDDVLLRKNSYTARQLYHNSPQNLYLASRGLLIGRIPPDWLKKSQKQWRRWTAIAVRRPKVKLSTSLIDVEMLVSFTRFRQKKLESQIKVKQPKYRERQMRRHQTFTNFRGDWGDDNESTASKVDINSIALDSSNDSYQEESSATSGVPFSIAPQSILPSGAHSDTSTVDLEFTDSSNTTVDPYTTTQSDGFGDTGVSEPEPKVAPGSSHTVSADTWIRQSRSVPLQASIITNSETGSFVTARTSQSISPNEPVSPARAKTISFIPGMARPNASNSEPPRTNSSRHVDAPRPLKRYVSYAQSTIASHLFDAIPEEDEDGFNSEDQEADETDDEFLDEDEDDLNIGLSDGEYMNARTQRHRAMASFAHNQNQHRKASAEAHATHANRNYLRNLLHRDVKDDSKSKKQRDIRFYHKHRGEVLFRHKLLVQVRETIGHIHATQKISEFDNPESVCTDRWQEYTAVARYTGRQAAPVCIFLYRADEDKIDKKMRHRWSRSLKYKIHLDRSYRAQFFSTLDLTLALWSTVPRHRNGRTVIYLFSSQSIAAQVSWLYFLSNSINDRTIMPEFVKVNVPDLELEVELPARELLKRAEKVTQENLLNSNNGDESASEVVTYGEIRKSTSSPSKLVAAIMDDVWTTAQKLGLKTNDNRLLSCRGKFGIAWRRFDRIRWLLDASDLHLLTSWAMSTTHELEFREKQSSTRRIDINGERVHEPTSVEGFCWRLSTWRNSNNFQRARRMYLHSHDHLLFYSSGAKTLLPLITHDGKVVETSDSQELLRLANELPVSFKIEPYELDDDANIEWIKKCKDGEDFEKYDAFAVFENERRSTMVCDADGMIDMTYIVDIRPSSHEHMFEIAFVDDQNVLMRVSDKESRDLWVGRLRSLVQYWKMRRQIDAHRSQDFQRKNLKKFDMTSNILSQPMDKSESQSALVDPLTYTPLAMAGGRSIIFSSYIYEKASKFHTFRNYYAVLTPQSLVLFQVQYRSSSKKATPQQVHFRRYRTFDLHNTYVYCGLLTSDHLIEDDRYFNPKDPGVRALPRAYADGWTSQDTEVERCFVLWMADKSHGRLHKLTGKQGVKGRRIVCLARSRYERDLWVSFLQDTVTRLSLDTPGN